MFLHVIFLRQEAYSLNAPLDTPTALQSPASIMHLVTYTLFLWSKHPSYGSLVMLWGDSGLSRTFPLGQALETKPSALWWVFLMLRGHHSTAQHTLGMTRVFQPSALITES